MKTTMSIQAAQAAARAAGLVSLQKAVDQAGEQGWDRVTLKAEADGEGGWDVGVTEPSGVMVAWMLPDYVAEQVAIPGGEPSSQLHVTLAYLGDAGNLSLDDQRKLIGVVGEVCLTEMEQDGQLTGVGRFTNGEATDPLWVGVNLPGLQALRQHLVTALTDAGFQLQGMSGAEYTPHVTVAYIPAEQADPPLDFAPLSVEMKSLTVAVGPKQFTLKLQEDNDADDYPAMNMSGWTPGPMSKAVEVEEEERYTLGPWYVPDHLDAHGEWTDKAEIKKSFHSYMGKEDRQIRLQHNTDIIAGERVDGMVMPHPYTVTMKKATGEEYEHTFPAGTPFLGVHWKPWAFELVKKGLIRGYSIGGSSARMTVDLPVQ